MKRRSRNNLHTQEMLYRPALRISFSANTHTFFCLRAYRLMDQ